MYSPKIKADYIPILYQIAQARGIPMTQIVREALEEYLNKAQIVAMPSSNGGRMTCPHCKKEITSVYVYSTCHQTARISTDGKILELAQPELEETTDIACPQCLKSLKEVIHA